MNRFTGIVRSQKGATAIEYALIASLISIACIGAIKTLSTQIDAMFTNVSSHMDSHS